MGIELSRQWSEGRLNVQLPAPDCRIVCNPLVTPVTSERMWRGSPLLGSKSCFKRQRIHINSLRLYSLRVLLYTWSLCLFSLASPDSLLERGGNGEEGEEDWCETYAILLRFTDPHDSRVGWELHDYLIQWLVDIWGLLDRVAFRGSSRSIFTTSTTATLLFNILEMQVKIMFEKRHLLLKATTEDRGSSPAACMNLCSKQSCIFFSDPSSNQELITIPYLVVCYVKQKSASLSHLSQFCFLETDRNSLNQFPT